MGQRGPPPTPTDILKLRGSWRAKGRLAEPKPPKGAPRCPSWLAAAAKIVWRQMVAILTELKVLTKADGNALARYCVMWVEWQACTAFVLKYGISYPLKEDKGKVKCFQQFPEVAQRNKLSGDLAKLEAEFGLTPAARTRIEVEVPDLPAPVRKRERRA